MSPLGYRDEAVAGRVQGQWQVIQGYFWWQQSPAVWLHSNDSTGLGGINFIFQQWHLKQHFLELDPTCVFFFGFANLFSSLSDTLPVKSQAHVSKSNLNFSCVSYFPHGWDEAQGLWDTVCHCRESMVPGLLLQLLHGGTCGLASSCFGRSRAEN